MSPKNLSQNSNMQSTFGTQSAIGTQSAFCKQAKATKKTLTKDRQCHSPLPDWVVDV